MISAEYVYKDNLTYTLYENIYNYDAKGRMRQFYGKSISDVSANSNYSAIYTYDKNNNITSVEVKKTSKKNSGASYADVSLYSYDNNGNQIRIDTGKENVSKKLFVIYSVLPANIAIKEENIDITKNYIIVEMYMATDVDFYVLYDSQNRDISFIQYGDRIKNSFINFQGFKNDYMMNLNKYVIYTNDNDIEYTQTGNTLHIKNYDINILYPVKRNVDNSLYPKGWVFRFEEWFEM